MPGKKKKSYHHGDLRRSLLDASLAIVKEKGLAALHLREAARRAGVSPGAPYHHFASLEALIGELAAEGFELLRESMVAEAERAPHGDTLDRFAAIGRGYVQFAQKYPGHFRLMFYAVAEECPTPDLAPKSEGALAMLLGTVKQLQSEGLAIGDPNSLALLAWSAVHGAAELVALRAVGGRASPLPIAAEEVGAKVTDLLMLLVRGNLREPVATR